MKKQYSVDRFEGNEAILIGEEETLVISKNILPKEIKEGDILFWDGKNYRIDAELSEKLRRQTADLIEHLFE